MPRWRVPEACRETTALTSDQLNRTNELRILDVRIEDLVDGHVIEMPELVVAHEELCAVWAAGPRGDVARRLATRTARVEIEIGPYRVEERAMASAAS
jgi:hypothetical protein